jgi:hypothetical protein
MHCLKNLILVQMNSQMLISLVFEPFNRKE